MITGLTWTPRVRQSAPEQAFPSTGTPIKPSAAWRSECNNFNDCAYANSHRLKCPSKKGQREKSTGGAKESGFKNSPTEPPRPTCGGAETDGRSFGLYEALRNQPALIAAALAKSTAGSEIHGDAGDMPPWRSLETGGGRWAGPDAGSKRGSQSQHDRAPSEQ